MFFTIYQTTNIINNKIYVGFHITSNLNDEYLGSGKILGYAIKKYGRENFKKEILHIFDNAIDMYAKEAEIVNEDFIKRKDTYNIKLGGHGGFDYINKNGLGDRSKAGKLGRKEADKTMEKNYGPEWRKIFSKMGRDSGGSEKGLAVIRENHPHPFLGMTHTQETKDQISESMKGNCVGSKNSQFGTCWITNGKENAKIKIEDFDLYLPLGFSLGRKF